MQLNEPFSCSCNIESIFLEYSILSSSVLAQALRLSQAKTQAQWLRLSDRDSEPGLTLKSRRPNLIFHWNGSKRSRSLVWSKSMPFLKGGRHLWTHFSQSFSDKNEEFLCSSERKFPEFSKTPPTFLHRSLLMASTAVWTLINLFFGTPCIFILLTFKAASILLSLYQIQIGNQV